MNRWDQERADALEDEAVAIRAQDTLVTVQLSLPVAWILRDAIGVGPLRDYAKGIRVQGDLERLNAAIPGHRVHHGPHVSRWSARIVRKMQEAYNRR